MKLSVLVLALLAPFSLAADPADLLLKNATVITMDETQPKAQAVAVRGDRIVWLGSNKDAAEYKGPKTKVMDLQGLTVIPGFIEGHAHLTGIGMSKMVLDLMDVANWDEIVNMVAEAAKEAPEGTWIVGRGWHQDKWNKTPKKVVEGYPTHHELSAVSPKHPVMLVHASGHALFANAKAMELGKVNASTKDPSGGKIVRDEAGDPIGVFEENAESLIYKPKQSYEASRSDAERKAESIKAIELAMEECLKHGITSFHDAGVPFSTIDLYKELADADKLKIRLWVMAGASNIDLEKNLGNYQIKDYGKGFLTLGGIKMYMDGALGSRGAWLLKPYTDLPSSTGQNVTSLAALGRTAEIAKKHNLQLCVHAIGDRGNREVLDLYEKVGGKNRRWRIEHAQHLNPEDIPRFAELGVIASMQGVHCTSDAPFVEKRLGKERAEHGAYVWRRLTDSGAVVTNGTDAPVERVSALASYYSMVTRKLADGSYFYRGQTLSPVEALASYTSNNAYAAYQEKDKGTLSVGKFADMAILSHDITTVPADEIRKAQVRYTIVGGKIAYSAD